MTLWMNALRSGKIISKESFGAMTADYTNAADHYGYGLEFEMSGGAGHFGSIGFFRACDCIFE